MSTVNLIYNCSGEKYWEIVNNEDYRRLCLYEGHCGDYIGEIIDNEVFDSNTGDYLGEINDNRLMVNKNKMHSKKIKGNFMFKPSRRMGYRCVKNEKKIEIPKGYEDFNIMKK